MKKEVEKKKTLKETKKKERNARKRNECKEKRKNIDDDVKEDNITGNDDYNNGDSGRKKEKWD